MLPLHDRLQRVVEILKISNKQLDEFRAAEDTGFVSFWPEKTALAVEELVAIRPPPGISVDLGCGNGVWLLLAAAAGYDSYGIEIHPGLVECAKENLERARFEGLIPEGVKIDIAIGNFYPAKEKAAMIAYRDERNENPASMPWDEDIAWDHMPIKMGDIDIFYCWAWPGQSRFLYNWLERDAPKDAIFALPSYLRYTQGEHMNASFREPNKLILSQLNKTDVFLGRRAE